MNAFQRATSFENLTAIWQERFKKLKRSCFGVDRVTAEKFEQNRPTEIRNIRRRLSEEDGAFKSLGLLALAKKKEGSEK